MGLTISSKNHSIDMGYCGFSRLRTKVAELTGKEIGNHYHKLSDGMLLFREERKSFFEDYNEKISVLEKKYKIPSGVIDFLYACDADGKLSYGKCRQLYNIIKDYDDDVLYGYYGRNDCAMFKDFKKIIKDCVENKCKLEWS